jgi:PAS domain S-box-containing protein
MKTVIWYKSLSFQAIFALLFITLWLVLGIVLTMNTSGKKLISMETSKVIEKTGNNAVSRLTARSSEIAALTRTLAATAEKLPKSETTFKYVFPNLIDFQGDLDVAGGGIWPEPYTFQTYKERRSFFWGRESDGTLKYYDDYNQPGRGYHNEEWYVAVRHAKQGTCSWSESYMDPYSYQPMVTCTVATFDQQSQFSGTVTIDLKLEGLQAIAETLQKETGGYVFILDRNNKFITFPRPELVKKIAQDSQGNRTEEFILTSDFAKKYPLFSPLSEALDAMNQDILMQARQKPNYDPNIAVEIERDSYQIDTPKAELLSAVIANPLNNTQTKLYQKVTLENDFLLKEPSTAFIFHVPESYWKLLIVKPHSEINAVAYNITQLLIIYLVATTLLILALAYLALNHFLIKPLSQTSHAVQTMGALVADRKFNQLKSVKINPTLTNEIGLLIQVFDAITSQVAEQHKQLIDANKVLEAKNEQLKRLDELKDEFLANTSHELRTPLNGIIGIAESLNDGAAGPLSEEVQKNLLMIAQSGHRLSNLVNDILDFSKLKHKNLELQLKAVGIREVTEVVLTLCQPLLGHKPVQLINAIAPDLPPAYADENRLQQIIYNLVGNAIKFTESGRIEISAKVIDKLEGFENKPGLTITVSDTGIGIPADKLDRIFESFEQGEGTTEREYGGTGLGLAVTQQLVELHNGHIRVESAVSVGSRFSFTLPIAQEEKSQAQISQLRHQALIEMSQPLTPAQATSGQSKILVVDDEPVNIQVLVNHLSLQNYAVYQASNGKEALDMINEEFKPDLILLDVMMPKMTGYEVCRRLREQFPLNELPILMLTAKNQVSDMVKGLEMGANDYLAKPVSKDELLARVKTQIQLYQIHVENAELYDELHENEQRLTQILEAMPVGVNVTDASGRNYYTNKTALQIVGQSLETSSCFEEWPAIFQAHQAGTSQLYRHKRLPAVQALKGQKSRVDDIEIRQGDEIIPIEMWGTPIFDDKKQVNYAITAFADITERLKREQAEREREAAEAVNKMMTDSIQYAKIIQSSLLPNFKQVKTYLPNSFFLWMPRDIVGGDMIYAQLVEDGMIIAIVDCTGHGVPGAFMTMVASTQLRRIIRDEGCYEPSNILKRLNFLVKTSLQQDSAHARSDDGLDAAICWLKPDEKTLSFAGAKLPLYYIYNDQLSVIAGDKQSLGYKRSNLDFKFTTHTISIEPSMSFYMSTDGFLDQLGGSKRFPFGNKRFRQLLMKNRHHAFDEQSAQMVRAFNEYKGEHDRQDDVTVVGFNLVRR